MSKNPFNASETGDTNREKDHYSRMVDILTLPDFEQQLVTWIIRQREVSFTEAIAYMNQDEKAVFNMLNSLTKQGFLQELNKEGEVHYRSSVTPKQGSRDSQHLWQELDS